MVSTFLFSYDLLTGIFKANLVAPFCSLVNSHRKAIG